MDNERKTREIFARCYRLMYQVGASISDEFFADLWSRESDRLLSDFIIFLRVRGERLAQGQSKSDFSARPDLAKVGKSMIPQSNPSQHSENVAKNGRIVQCLDNVAQCSKALGTRLQKIFELLEILKHIGQTDAATPLFLERELLKLRLAVLNSIDLPKQLKNQKDRRFSESSRSPSPVQDETKLFGVYKEILNFIKSRGDQIQNTEIFARFGNIHRRTIKRKLSDLVLSGFIIRSAKGKRVYYQAK